MAAEAYERGQRSLPGTVSVKLATPHYALVALRGEHDLSTQAQLREALRRACRQSNVVIDLSACEFIDSMTIGLLIASHDVLSEHGGQLEIALPSAASVVKRAFDLLSVRELLSVSESLAAAVSKLESAPTTEAWLRLSPPLPVD